MPYVVRYVLPVGPDTYLPGDIITEELDWPNLGYLKSLGRLAVVHTADEAVQQMLGVGVSEDEARLRASRCFGTSAPAKPDSFPLPGADMPEPMASAMPIPEPKRRGRPPKAEPEAAPKKRGRLRRSAK